MRLIHCADIHLDSRLTSGLTKEQAALRNRELLAGFVRLVEEGARQGVRLMLIAGDLFDRRQVKKTTIHVLSSLIEEHPDIDFLYLQGNHDPSSVFIDSYHGNLPPNLKLFSREWTSYEYEDVVITGAEVSPGDNAPLYSSLRLDPLKTNILMLHGQVIHANGPARGELIPLRSLQNRYIDYLALGHLHGFSHERLDERGTYCYSGCLEARGFDEPGEKGYMLLETADRQIRASFVPFGGRACHEVEVEAGGVRNTPDLLNRIRRKLSGIPKEDLVKVVLTGSVEAEAGIDVPFMEEQLKGSCFYLRIKDETTAWVDYEAYRLDRSLKGEFIRLIHEQSLPDDEKEKLIRRGLKALAGEEI